MLLDSNIIILYLNGDRAVIAGVNALQSTGRALFVSATTIVEVRSLSSLSVSDLQIITRFMNQFIVIPIDQTIAEKAGDLRRTTGLGFADSIIISTAVVKNLPFVTRDKKLHHVREVQFVTL
jgi:predicted nucleic acid-binding protein